MWLPVAEGREALLGLHDRLYRGPLAEFLDRTRQFQPHVTIGRATPAAAERICAEARTLTGPYSAWINRFIIERIGADESSFRESEVLLALGNAAAEARGTP